MTSPPIRGGVYPLDIANSNFRQCSRPEQQFLFHHSKLPRPVSCYTSQKSRGIGCENGELKSEGINVAREESEKAFCSQKAIQATEGGAKGQSRGKRNKCRRPRVARYAGLPLDGTAAPRTTPAGNSVFPAQNARKPRDDNPVKSATRYTYHNR